MTDLTERRKADREAMALRVEELCAKHGARCERRTFFRPREITLEIEMGGVRVFIDFDGERCAQLLDRYCLPWNVSVDSSRRLSEAFGAFQCAEVNRFHRRKCTTFSEGFDDLLDKLTVAFRMLADGSAFEAVAA